MPKKYGEGDETQNSSGDAPEYATGYSDQDDVVGEFGLKSSVPQKPSYESEPYQSSVMRSQTVNVRMMNKKPFNGKYLVQNVDSGAMRLVEEGSLRYAVGEQQINLSSFEAGDEPYDWTNEIRSLSVDEDQIRQALWSAGLIEKQNLSRQQLIHHIFSRGLVPLIK